MDVKNIKTDDLEAMIGEVTQAMATIKTQLEFAKSNAAELGEYSDSNWFNKARHALRMKGREHQLMLVELGSRRKSERREFASSLERNFMVIAKKKMGDEEFTEILKAAMDLTHNLQPRGE